MSAKRKSFTLSINVASHPFDIPCTCCDAPIPGGTRYASMETINRGEVYLASEEMVECPECGHEQKNIRFFDSDEEMETFKMKASAEDFNPEKYTFIAVNEVFSYKPPNRVLH